VAFAFRFQDATQRPGHEVMADVEGAGTKYKRDGDEIRNMGTYRVLLCVKRRVLKWLLIVDC
jgi:hypothetical protein